jgi:ferredoxin
MATHTVTFLPMNVTVTVDDEKYPLADHGRPGSLLDIALANDVPLDHNCGGSCACTTCHVIVRQGEENLSEMQPDEEDRLDMAEGLTIHSRLGWRRQSRRSSVGGGLDGPFDASPSKPGLRRQGRRSNSGSTFAREGSPVSHAVVRGAAERSSSHAPSQNPLDGRQT